MLAGFVHKKNTPAYHSVKRVSKSHRRFIRLFYCLYALCSCTIPNTHTTAFYLLSLPSFIVSYVFLCTYVPPMVFLFCGGGAGCFRGWSVFTRRRCICAAFSIIVNSISFFNVFTFLSVYIFTFLHFYVSTFFFLHIFTFFGAFLASPNACTTWLLFLQVPWLA